MTMAKLTCGLCLLFGLLIGVDAEKPAISIGIYLKSLARRELGVDQLQDFLHFDKGPSSAGLHLETLGKNLEGKLETSRHFLHQLSQDLALNLASFGDTERELLSPCCSSHPNHELGCSVMHLGYNGTRKARIAAQVFDTWQYKLPKGAVRRFFMTTDRTTHLEFPASRACGQQAYTWHREFFIKSLNPQKKSVMILLDRGHHLSTLQLDIGTAIAGFVIDSLSIQDKISLLTLDASINDAGANCSGAWAWGSDVTKKTLHSHLNSINRMSYRNYNHVSALHQARDLFGSEELIHMFIISTASSISMPDKFVQTCQELASEDQRQVVIHIYLMDNNRTELTDKNGEKLAHLVDKLTQSCQNGNIQFKILDSTLLLSYNIGPLFMQSKKSQSKEWISVPWNELNDQKFLFTLTHHVSDEAVIGLDIEYAFLMQDFILAHLEDKSAKLVVLDLATQSVVFHPQLVPRLESQLPQGIRLHQLEKVPTFLESDIFEKTSGFHVQSFDQKEVRFSWRQVGNYFAILEIREVQKKASAPEKSKEKIAKLTKSVMAVYHRLDLLDPQYQAKLCLHMHQPATLETATVFLAPKAFVDSYDQWQNQNLTKKRVTTVMRYLTSNDNRPNPGLKPGIHHDLHVLAQVLPTWKNMSFASGMNNYIVRRFAASQSGIFFTFPGTSVPKNMDPSGQAWFVTAQRFAHRVILSRPRLDPGGAGNVLTVSQSVDPDHLLHEEPGFVMGMDLTIGYINKMLLDSIPICRNMLNDGVRCFLFDHEGYLILHPSFFEAGSPSRQVEGRHLTHLEQSAMTLMLKDSSLVQKSQCRQFSDMTLQSFYEFNTSSSVQSIWTSAPEDEECIKYQVSWLPETNIFLGIVLSNQSCPFSKGNICPCSRNGHQCLLCQEHDQDWSSICECPCQCSLKQCKDSVHTLPLCPAKAQSTKYSKVHLSLPKDLALPPCFDTECSRHTHEDKCFGIIGCSWCQMEDSENGLKHLDEPFCSEQATCWGGVLESSTPYDQLERGSRLLENEKYFFRPTPSVGPIVGSILSAVLFLGISAYCIRNVHQWSCLRDRNHRRQRQGSMLQVASFEEVIEDHDNAGADELHELGVTHKNANLIVSPYRVNPSYRRPPPGTDSDHGYSTMTPMGDLDSEIVPYVESSSARSRLQRFQQRNHTTTQSVTSGVSSRTSSPVLNAGYSTGDGLADQSSSVSLSEENSISRGACKPVSVMRKVPEDPHSGRLMSESSEDSPSHTQLLDPQTMLPRPNNNQFIVAATVHKVDA